MFSFSPLITKITFYFQIDAVAIKRKAMKTKIKKTNIQNIVAPPCACQKPVLDINCGCRGSIIEAALGAINQFEIPITASPVIDVPNYRYADPLEISPLGCLFPTIEIPNYGMLSAPVTLPSVEYFTAVDQPCGCPGPKCGCRAPAVKLPACPREFLASIEVPSCGCSGTQLSSLPIGQIIEIPAYTPVCGCQGPCSCPRVPCGCQGPCSCSGMPVSTCGCQGPCTCAGIPVAACGCQGPCTCPEYQVLSCGCQGACSCPEYQILSCGCQGSCSCSGMPVSGCGCSGPCGCGGKSCGCQGPCACSGMPLGVLPIQVPACGCGECTKYLRQVTLQPPFL